jgi:HKD family nuclease
MATGTRPTNVTLVLNEPPNDHCDVLKSLLRSALRFQCMTAFAKQTGLTLIREELKVRLDAGLKARFVIGLNFYQTDPSVLEELLSFGERYTTLELLVSTPETQDSSAWNFHPKVFTFEDTGGTSVLIGSANMTGGGLADNHEASILVRNGSEVITKRIDQQIKQLIRDKQIVTADAALIREYARRHAIYKVHKKLAERRAQRAFEQTGGIVIDTLNEILTAMKANTTGSGFGAQRKSRSKSREQAQGLLARISDGPPLSKSSFLKLYEPLVAGVWKSGGLQRGKNVVARHAQAFQKALQSLGSIESLSVERAFDVLHQGMRGVNRAGINVMTEILHSLDNLRFAVMNQNSVSGLSLANITGFPKNPKKENVDAAIYADFCNRAGNVRDQLKLKNFTELDALLDYAYWAE